MISKTNADGPKNAKIMCLISWCRGAPPQCLHARIALASLTLMGRAGKKLSEAPLRPVQVAESNATIAQVDQRQLGHDGWIKGKRAIVGRGAAQVQELLQESGCILKRLRLKGALSQHPQQRRAGGKTVAAGPSYAGRKWHEVTLRLLGRDGEQVLQQRGRRRRRRSRGISRRENLCRRLGQNGVAARVIQPEQIAAVLDQVVQLGSADLAAPIRAMEWPSCSLAGVRTFK